MLKKVEAVFLWTIGVLLIYGAIAVFCYGFYVLFWSGPLVEVYVGEFRQMLSIGPGLAWMILSVIMVFVGKAILTKENEIEAELTHEKFRREKETLKNKIAPYHADESREEFRENRFDEIDPEIDPEIDFETIDQVLNQSSGQRRSGFETIYPLLDPASKNWPDGFDDDKLKDEIKTIDLLLEPTSGHRANSFEEDESKYEIESIDLSLDLLSMDRANGFDEDDTDLGLATANETPEYKSPYPKKYLDEDDTELEYPEE